MPLLIFTATVATGAASQIWPPAAGPSVSAKRVSIFNAGPNPINIGPSGVATTTGFKILANGTYSFNPSTVNGPIFAIADTADQAGAANTRILVETSD